ncbi:MAG: hypothetical protein A2Z02_00420 [Chloroflexi bacterium RBG_16_48_7]|nr:MAG: hypothetical protein A2Z02_00420 [Chloroflexi bacterium RBG_16_48_7]
MEISNKKFLIFAVLYAACTFTVYYLAPGIVATILLFPFFLFFPGHALLSLLFPCRNALSKLARIFAGIGAGIGIITLLGLIVALLPWGLNPNSVVIATLAFNIIFSLAAIIRDFREPRERRLCLDLSLPAWQTAFFSSNRLEKLLLTVFLAIVLVTAGVLVFSLILPPAGEQFTEFYILPSISGSDKYPLSSITGQPTTITLVIVNHEKQKQGYSIETRLNKNNIGKKDTPELAPGQKLEIPIAVSIENPGLNQKLEFYLYKAGEAAPLLKDALSITLDVASAAK